MGKIDLLHGDCLDRMKELAPDTIDCIVSDPPYGLGAVKDFRGMLLDWIGGGTGKEFTSGAGFMGRSWDYGVPPPIVWAEAYRILKPGGFVFAFAASRTAHYMAISLELAGFKPHPAITWLGWLYLEGMPKGTNLGKQIDKKQPGFKDLSARERVAKGIDITAPLTPEGKEWEGWYYGQQTLTPTYEPILCFQKPYPKGVSAVDSITEYGVGAFNMDGMRVTDGIDRSDPAVQPNPYLQKVSKNDKGNLIVMQGSEERVASTKIGRLPANVVLSHMPTCKIVDYRRTQMTAGSSDYSDHLPFVPGSAPATETIKVSGQRTYEAEVPVWQCADGCPVAEFDRQTGGRAHMLPQCNPAVEDEWPFRYVIKPKDREKNAGLEDFEDRAVKRWNNSSRSEDKNSHPTVKPVALMKWLIQLCCRPGATVLDPFLGSGTTMVAVAQLQREMEINGIGIEREDDFIQICRARIADIKPLVMKGKDGKREVVKARPKDRQRSIFDMDGALDVEEHAAQLEATL